MLKKVMFIMKLWKLIALKKYFIVVNNYTGEIVLYNDYWNIVVFTKYIWYLLNNEVDEVSDMKVKVNPNEYENLYD